MACDLPGWPGRMVTAYELADCPACGAAEARQLADRDDIRAQLERLWQFHMRRLRPGTPPRRLTDRLSFSQRPPVRLVACAGCATVYRDPRERERTLHELYAEEGTDHEALESLFRAQLGFYRERAARLTAFAGRPGRGLEVGSYVGAFLVAAREQGWDFRGLDVNDSTNDFARGMGLDVDTGAIDGVRAVTDHASDDDPLDAVALWNCFDQLADPRAALRRIRRRLGAGGVLVLRVPSGDLYAALARRADLVVPAAWLLALNNLLGFPYRQGFSHEGIRRLLEESGFRVCRVRGDALVPLADPWTRTWAVWEERAAKTAMKVLLPRRMMPWIEVYAVRG